MKCPQCHFDNPQDTSFCGKCGTQIRPSGEIPFSATETLKISPMVLSKGSVFGGKYEIIGQIGRGGMGVVYKVRGPFIWIGFAALKTLSPERVVDPDRKRRFVHEAKSASALNHPNIITIYDIDQEAGVDFIAMDMYRARHWPS